MPLTIYPYFNSSIKVTAAIGICLLCLIYFIFNPQPVIPAFILAAYSFIAIMVLYLINRLTSLTLNPNLKTLSYRKLWKTLTIPVTDLESLTSHSSNGEFYGGIEYKLKSGKTWCLFPLQRTQPDIIFMNFLITLKSLNPPVVFDNYLTALINPNTSPPHPPFKLHRYAVIEIFAAVIIPLFLLLIFFFRSYHQPAARTIPPSPTVSPQPTSAISWKTFSNLQDGFEFQYPDNWEEHGTGTSDDYFQTASNNKIFLTVINDTSKTIAEYLQKKDQISQTAYEGQPSVVVKSTKITVINNLNCIQRQEYLAAAGFTQISTYFKKGSLVISITLQPADENSNAEDILSYNHLLSTFKFISPPSEYMSEDFSFQYPIGWQVGEKANTDCGYTQYISDPSSNTSITINNRCNQNPNTGKPYSSLEEFFGKYPVRIYTRIDNIEIAQTYSMINSLNTFDGLVFISPGNKIISISQYPPSNDSQLLKSILSSFKFTESPTFSDWKTYQNETYGFEFQYPSTYVHQDSVNNINLAEFKTTDDKTLNVLTDNSTAFSLKYLHKYAPTGLEGLDPEKQVFVNNTFYYYGPGGGGVCYPDQFFFNLNNKVLILEFSGCENDKQPPESTKTIEQQILSTFKFLK